MKPKDYFEITFYACIILSLIIYVLYRFFELEVIVSFFGQTISISRIVACLLAIGIIYLFIKDRKNEQYYMSAFNLLGPIIVIIDNIVRLWKLIIR